jgi:hypothetical protein
MDKIKNFLGIGDDCTPRLFALYSCPISSPAKITVVYYILDEPTRYEVKMKVKNFLEPDNTTGSLLIKSKLFSRRDQDIPTLHVYQANLPLLPKIPYLLDFIIEYEGQKHTDILKREINASQKYYYMFDLRFDTRLRSDDDDEDDIDYHPGGIVTDMETQVAGYYRYLREKKKKDLTCYLRLAVEMEILSNTRTANDLIQYCKFIVDFIEREFYTAKEWE